ncbi:MAG: hypothetical protein RR786_04135 [Anaerorhabdus sp.]
MKDVLSTHIVYDATIKKCIYSPCAKKAETILTSLKLSRIGSVQKLKMKC